MKLDCRNTPLSRVVREVVPESTSVAISIDDAMQAAEMVRYVQGKWIAPDTRKGGFLERLLSNGNALYDYIMEAN